MRPYGPSLPTRHWPLWLRYLGTIVLFGFVLLLQAVWAEAAQFPFLFFFSSIIVSAALFDRGASIIATVLAAGTLALFAWKPELALSSPGVLDWVGWSIFVVVALFTGGLIELLNITLKELQRAIQALGAAEQQKDLLLRESAHRTRNDFTQLIGMIKLEEMAARDHPYLQERLRAIADRIHVFTRLQNRLSRAQETAVVEIQQFIPDLCGDLQSSLAGLRPVKVEARADALPVPEPAAVAVGLIVNELVTNALKHAFPDNRAGKVEVIFLCRETGECTLCVEDDGVGIEGTEASKEPPQGLGQRLVRSLVSQLQGSYDIRPRTAGSGTIATVRFAASEGALRGSAG